MPASPSTTASAAELRQDLGTVAYERMLGASDQGFIGLRVMPIFRSPIGAGKFPVVPIEAALKAVDDARGPSGDYNEINWPFEMAAFATQDRGLEGRVDDSLKALYARLLDVETITTEVVTDQIQLNHERRVAAQLESDGGSATVTTPWTTAATATPAADIQAAKAAFRLQSGLLPNALALSLTAFWAALATLEIRTALQYTQPIQMGGFAAQVQALAQYFGVDQLLVAGGVKDTAKKGQSATIADIWSKSYVHLLRISQGGDQVMEPAYGRTILFTGAAADLLTTETYRDEKRRSDMVRVRNHSTEFVQLAAVHYKLGNICA